MAEYLDNFGKLVKFKDAKILFGQGAFTSADLDSPYCELKQVHGNRVLSHSTKKQTGDGHFTNEHDLALIIRTADCMPVFLCDDDCQLIMGLHIGWRGLAQKIFTEGVMVYRQQGIASNKLHAWLGPHIYQDNYWLPKASIEGLFLAHKITWQEAEKENIIRPARQAFQHWNINLAKILEKEAKGLGVKAFNDESDNTFTSVKHYSHRRYGFRRGLNYSLIRM